MNLFYEKINLINCNKYEKNALLIKENRIEYCTQGLYNSYWIMLYGNGHNKYIFTVKIILGKEYKIIVEEKHIIKWKIAHQLNEYDNKPYYSIDFEALGKIEETDRYIKLYSNGYDSFRYMDDILEIIDITIENDKQEKSFIDIDNEYDYIELVQQPAQNLISDIYKNEICTIDMERINYVELFDKNNWNKTMYFMFVDCNIVKFEIIEIKKSEDYNIDIMTANVYHECNKFYTENIKLYYDLDDDDISNIKCNIQINYIEFDKKYDIVIDEFCYIAKIEK
jgi:hypothetical protein